MRGDKRVAGQYAEAAQKALRRYAAGRMVRQVLPWALIAAGVIISAFALISRLSVSSQQQRLVDGYRSTEQSATTSAQVSGNAGPDTDAAIVSSLPDPDAAEPSAGEEPSPTTLAVLSIPSIDLEVAVRQGVGSYSLRYSVGHYAPSVMPGDEGNCVIMGHRNYTYGQFFNRLDELDTGDTIILERGGVIYTYVVTEKFVVEPSETYVLDPTDGATLTLITCTPIRVATHRLIVRCALQSAQVMD